MSLLNDIIEMKGQFIYSEDELVVYVNNKRVSEL